MTREQLDENIKSMLQDVMEGIEKECGRLVMTGGIDIADWPDNYRLPRILLSVAIENTAKSIVVYDGDEKEVKNLRHF